MESLFAALSGDFLGTPTYFWVAFIAIVIALLVFDLGILHREEHEIGAKESLLLSGFYVLIALAFGAWVWFSRGAQSGLEFYTGYLIEQSLAMDNMFVIATIFGFLGIPRLYQHRVLFWGILGVILFRAILIGVGAALVHQFEAILFLFGAFLVFTGIRMFSHSDDEPDMENNKILIFLRKHFRITNNLHGRNFTVRAPDPKTGKLVTWLTPLAVALIMVEIVDLINNDAGNAGRVSVSLNPTGNGLKVTDSTTGGGSLVIAGTNGADAAEALGLSGTFSGGSATGSNLQLAYLGRSTLLSSLNRGEGIGTRHLLTHGVQSDYAVVADGSDLNIIWTQNGVVDLKITVFGKAKSAWNSDRATEPSIEMNAVVKMAKVVEALEEWGERFEADNVYHASTGPMLPKVNVGAIEGGAPYKPNYFPGVCSIYLDVRIPPQVKPVSVQYDVADVLRGLEALGRAAIAALPQAFAEQLGDVVFAVEDFADEETLRELGMEDPFELTGVYEGHALTELLVGGVMEAARGDVAIERQLEPPLGKLPAAHNSKNLEPGAVIELTGEFRVPLAQLNPIRRGEQALFVPIVRLRAAAASDGNDPVIAQQSILLGRADQGPELAPIRLDQGPRVYRHIGQRLVAPQAA